MEIICDQGKKKSKKEPCWNDMEELKHLICSIDCLKCPRVPSPPSCTIILPPRVEEIPCEVSPQRPPCVPPPRCCPITSGPCCPWPLPCPTPPCPATLTQPPPLSQRSPSSYWYHRRSSLSPLPCYPIN